MNKYIQANSNWSTGPWYDAPTNGNVVSKPGVGDNAYINNKTLNIDEDITCDNIISAGSSSGMNLSPASCILNTNIVNSGGWSVGMFQFSNKTLTINGSLQNYASHMIFGRNNNISIYNEDIAINSNSSTIGQAIRSFGGNNILVSGDITSQAQFSIISLNSADKCNIIGDIASGSGEGIFNFDGDLKVTGKITGGYINLSSYGAVELSSQGVFTWIGDYTIESGEHLIIGSYNTASGIILANDNGVLNLTNNGTLMFSTPNELTYVTNNEINGSASIIDNTPVSNTMIFPEALRGIVVRPTFPEANEVKQNVTYGYPGELQTGTYAQSGRVSLIKLST